MASSLSSGVSSRPSVSVVSVDEVSAGSVSDRCLAPSASSLVSVLDDSVELGSVLPELSGNGVADGRVNKLFFFHF